MRANTLNALPKDFTKLIRLLRGATAYLCKNLLCPRNRLVDPLHGLGVSLDLVVDLAQLLLKWRGDVTVPKQLLRDSECLVEPVAEVLCRLQFLRVPEGDFVHVGDGRLDALPRLSHILCRNSRPLECFGFQFQFWYLLPPAQASRPLHHVLDVLRLGLRNPLEDGAYVTVQRFAPRDEAIPCGTQLLREEVPNSLRALDAVERPLKRRPLQALRTPPRPHTQLSLRHAGDAHALLRG